MSTMGYQFLFHYAILMSANKTFLATHLFNESGDGLMQLLKGQ